MIGYDTLHIVLEDVGGTSRRASILTTLGSLSGSALLRFVGEVDGDHRYVGATFVSPRGAVPMAPREEWAPGLTAALQGLRREIEEHGWEYLGQGEQPWDLYYRRPRWE